MKIFLVLIILTIGLLLFIFIIKPRRKRIKRLNIIKELFPEEWENILKTKFTVYNKLPQDLQMDLMNKIKIFLDEKNFIGRQDLLITDEIKVLISAQACMLLLNRKTNFFPKLKSIYIYPTTYLSKQQVNLGGVLVEHSTATLGESWNSGELVLAWDSAEHGAKNMYDGKNVTYHEFAHQLDQEDGYADGAPILQNRSSYISWGQVLSSEYEKLIKKKKKRRKTVLHKYGATNPAEFFAVASESFFEKPRQLNKKLPELYNELKSYYQTDPLEWYK